MPESRTSILIVEDDEAILEALTELLQAEGYVVRGAANGREALAALREATAPPSVILLDLTMPVMDGVEFCVEQQKDQSLKNIPVIIMSAAGQLEQKLQGTPAQGYLRKPVSISAILDAVRLHATPAH